MRTRILWSTVCFLLMALIFIFGVFPDAKAANQKAMVADLERIAKQVRKGLPGKVILANPYESYYLVRIDTVYDVSYDVQTTKSLVSPYLGIITVTAKVSSNISSPRADGNNHLGFLTAAGALAAKEANDFVDDRPSSIRDSPELQRATALTATIQYAYQKGHWTLKSIEGGDFVSMTKHGNETVFDLFK